MGAGLDARASRGAFAAVNAGGAEPDARSANPSQATFLRP